MNQSLQNLGPLEHDYIWIRSEDRISGTSTNFRVNVPEQYSGVESVELIYAAIPDSVFNVTALNNVVPYVFSGGPVLAAVAPGAYSTASIVSAAPFGGGAQPLILSFNNTTMRATISSTSGGVFSLLWNSQPNNTMAKLLGFSSASDLSGSNAYSGTSAFDFTFPRYLYICIQQVPSFIDTTNPGDQPTFIIANTQNSGGIMTYNQKTNFDQVAVVNQVKLSFLDVSLRVPNNSGVGPNTNLTDLNGLEWTMLVKIGSREQTHL